MESNQIVFQGTSISTVWKEVLEYACENSGKEICPMVVTLTGFEEDLEYRKILNKHLESSNDFKVETVAETIFPESLYKMAGYDRHKLYVMYKDMLPRLHKIDRNNRRGLYFERLIDFDGKKNQLEIIIDSFVKKPSVRRSKLQASVFDPRVDHIEDAYQGFPCLQHISVYTTDEGLVLNSFYAIQYLYKKAYGNWLGLVNLGKFLAKEMGLELVQFNCFVSVEQLETPKTIAEVILEELENLEVQA